MAADGSDVSVSNPSAADPATIARLTREFLALYETAHRLIWEKRVFPVTARPDLSPRAREACRRGDRITDVGGEPCST
jgi:hypothetical protein